MLKREEIRIRDPFILLDGDNYYMYGTTDFVEGGTSTKTRFSVYVSKDLEHFEGPYVVFDGQKEEFWGKYDYWASEVWKYDRKYYLFGSFKSDDRHRGTQILESDSPLGPFKQMSERAITPKEMECLDGTLYQDGDCPYMVFCHEWTQCGDGEIYAVELSKDLRECKGEPFLLFKASDNKYVTSIYDDKVCKVTDGPFLFKEEGLIKMIWSSFIAGRYVVLEASAKSIKGKWTHFKSRFNFDGGHAMLFTGKDGKKYFSLHSPNNPQLERAVFIPYK
jgi:hypothetical protein